MSHSLRVQLVERLTSLAVESRDAVLSNAWWYPVMGITYFIGHPGLYRSVMPALVKSLTLSVAITGGLIFFTYLPQMAICAIFFSFFAPIAAAMLVLGEAYILFWVLGKPLMMANVQDLLFDEVLMQQGHQGLVKRGREVRTLQGGVQVAGKEIHLPKPRFMDDFSREGIVRYLISLPLNLVPGIGTAMFLLYNGKKQGPGYHARYFQLKGWDKKEQQLFVEQRNPAYAAFGAVGLALSLIPFVGLLLRLTTTVGAALWASKLERTGASVEGSGRHVTKEGEDANAM